MASRVIAIAVCIVVACIASGAQASAGQKAGVDVEDLLLDLQIVPLDGQTPKPFALPSLTGKRLSLADLRGRPALLYFWATW